MDKPNWQEDLIYHSQRKRPGYGTLNKQVSSLNLRLRVRILWVIFVLGVALILSKIMYLQIIERGQHQLISYSNHIELKAEVAPRGMIYDRDGEVVPVLPATAPVLGYLAEVTPDELGCFQGICYSQGMIIGRSGVQKVFERERKGRDGGDW